MAIKNRKKPVWKKKSAIPVHRVNLEFPHPQGLTPYSKRPFCLKMRVQLAHDEEFFIYGENHLKFETTTPKGRWKIQYVHALITPCTVGNGLQDSYLLVKINFTTGMIHIYRFGIINHTMTSHFYAIEVDRGATWYTRESGLKLETLHETIDAKKLKTILRKDIDLELLPNEKRQSPTWDLKPTMEEEILINIFFDPFTGEGFAKTDQNKVTKYSLEYVLENFQMPFVAKNNRLKYVTQNKMVKLKQRIQLSEIFLQKLTEYTNLKITICMGDDGVALFPFSDVAKVSFK